MSYLAIARKYRPANFAEIVGQDHVTRTLQNALRSGRIHHAFLFCGARGVGKTTAARALAKALNCENGPTPEPCGTCASCLAVASGTHPDLIEIDGASNNSVEDVRDLRETVHYAPSRGRYKVYLVDEVHMLSNAAFNALLKTLEEPPPHVVFLFATTEPNKVLDTILSRVQRFDFKRIGTAAVVRRLSEIAQAEGATLSDVALRMIAQAGEGSMRDAQSLLDKVISFSPDQAVSDDDVAKTLGLVDRGLLLDLLGGLVSGEPDICLDVIAAVYDYGYEMSQLSGDLLEYLRHATLLALSESAGAHIDLSADERARLLEVIDGSQPEHLTRLFRALLETHDQVSRSDRPRIVLEMAVARLATQRPLVPVAGLVARLEAMERRLQGGSQAPGGPGGAPPRGGSGGGRQAAAGVRGTPRASNRRRSRAPRRPATSKADEPDAAPAPPPPSVRARSTQQPAHPARPAAPSAPASPRPAPRSEDPAPRVEAPPAPATPPPRPTRAPAPEPTKPSSDAPTAGAQGPAGWSTLQTALRALGGGAARLAKGDASLSDDGTLRVMLSAGVALAEGRRAAVDARVQGLLARHLPRARRVEAVARPGTGTAVDQAAAMRAQVLKDPDFERVIGALQAELDQVTSLAAEHGSAPTTAPTTPATD